MTLISEEEIDGVVVKYYDGIDFNSIHNHPKDGSGGLMVCFISRWSDEVKKQLRSNKINQILDNNKEISNIDKIDNNYICIYQTDGYLEQVYNSIKDNLSHKIDKPWSPIGGKYRGLV